LASAGSESLDSGELQPAMPMLAISAVIMAANKGRLKRGLVLWFEHKVVGINNSVYQRVGQSYGKTAK